MIHNKKKYIFKIIVPIMVLCLLLNGCSKQDISNTDGNGDAITTSPSSNMNDVVSPDPNVETNDKPTVTVEPIAEPSLDPSIEPTAEPTSSDTGVAFLKQNYESFGRSDVYRLPFKDFNYNFEVMAARQRRSYYS